MVTTTPAPLKHDFIYAKFDEDSFKIGPKTLRACLNPLLNNKHVTPETLQGGHITLTLHFVMTRDTIHLYIPKLGRQAEPSKERTRIRTRNTAPLFQVEKLFYM